MAAGPSTVVVVSLILTGFWVTGYAGFSLTLLHTQDTYSEVVPDANSNSPCVPVNMTTYVPRTSGACIGGVAARAAMIEQVRSSVANVLLVDAGNMLVNSVAYFVFGPEIIATYYKYMAYDAVKIDVHDFATRAEKVALFVSMLEGTTKVICSNLIGAKNDSRFENVTIDPYAIFTYSGGQKVGYVGTMGEGLNNKFGDPRQLDSGDEVLALRTAVASLSNKGVNKIVAAISGPTTLEDVINQVPGIDVIILPSKFYGNNVTDATDGTYPQIRQLPWGQPLLIVATGTLGKYLGRLDLQFDDNGVITSWNGNSIRLTPNLPLDPVIQADLIVREVTVQAATGKIVGHTDVDLLYEDLCLFGECTIGSWAADVLKQTGQTQIALFNGGSVYASIPKGDITYAEEQSAFPLGYSTFWTYNLQGKYILPALENSVMLGTNRSLNINQGIGRFLQVSGLKFLWNPNEVAGMRIADVRVEVSAGVWELLDPNQSYSISSGRYIMAGGDDYTMISLNLQNLVYTGLTLDTLFLNYLESFSPIMEVSLGRINTTTITRRTCLDATGLECNGNGYCLLGRCQCTNPAAIDSLCSTNTTKSDQNSSNSTDLLPILLGTLLPSIFVLVITALVAGIIVVLMRNRRAREEWQISIDELEMGSKIGAGGFGEVFRAVWRGSDVAVKMLNFDSSMSKENRISFVDEMRVMSTLRHPNVVLFMAACTRPPKLCIVMEFMALGSLYDLLHNELVPDIPLGLRAKLAYQAAKGMHFLHSSGIVHRDLKSLNLLLDNKWNLKISDFGLTRFKQGHVVTSSPNGNHNALGSIHWTAPEVLTEEDDVNYVLSDVYSFGIVLWEIVSREDPYAGMTGAAVAVAVIRDGMRPEIPADADVKFRELMVQCWSQEPSTRPSFLDAMTRLSTMFDSSMTDSSSHSSSSRQVAHRSSTESVGSELKLSSSHKQFTLAEHAPEGSVATVITDVMGAGELWEVAPSDMCQAMITHNEVLRRFMKGRKGYEAILIGDQRGRKRGSDEGAFCVVFSNASDALSWCSEVQEALLAEQWPERILEHHYAKEEWSSDGQPAMLFRGLRVRMGVHVGEAQRIFDRMTARYQYLGPTVDSTAFITAMSNGGQIVMTRRAYLNFKQQAQEQAGEEELPQITPLGTYDVPSMPEGKCKIYEFKPKGLERRSFESLRGHVHGVYDDNSSTRTGSDDGSTRSQSTSAGMGSDQASREQPTPLASANLCRWVIPFEQIQEGEQIGMGSYGIVSRGKWKGVDVAIKRFVKQSLDERHMLEFRAEIAVLAELRHPNIVLFIGACVRSPNLCIVTEYVSRGSLQDILFNAAIKLTCARKITLLRNACLGIAYLHSLDPMIIHRDLKPSNLLVDENWNVKVADFGFARIKQANVTMTRCGTPCWTAPEIIRGERYSESADVYSFGIIMWQVFTRKQPYTGRNFMNVALDVLDGCRPPIQNECPSSYAVTMKRCWDSTPADRPTMEELVQFFSAVQQGVPAPGHGHVGLLDSCKTKVSNFDVPVLVNQQVRGFQIAVYDHRFL